MLDKFQYSMELLSSPDKSVVLNRLSSVQKLGHGRRSRRSGQLLNKVLFRRVSRTILIHVQESNMRYSFARRYRITACLVYCW